MSLLWIICQKCDPRHCLQAGHSQATCQALRTLVPPSALKRLQYPPAWFYRLARQDRQCLYSTGQSSLTRCKRQSSHGELQSTEQEAQHASESFKALRENKGHLTSSRSPNIVLDYGSSHSQVSRFEHATSCEGDNKEDSLRDSIFHGNQTMYDTILNSLDPEEMDSLSNSGVSSEGTEPPTATQWITGLSEEMDPLWESDTRSESTDPPTAAHRISSLPPQDCYTPSEAILYSLGSLSRMYTTFRDFSNKIDLSLPNMPTITGYGGNHAKPEPVTNSGEESSGSIFPTVRFSLQRLLAEYLRSCWPTTPGLGSTDIGPFDIAPSKDALKNVFSEKNIAFIYNEGYEPEDLISWAWIVTANSTDLAVRRLTLLSADLRFDSSESRMIPTFLVLFVLRRSNWSARALRMMIIHGHDRLEGYTVARGQPLDAAHEFSKRGAHSLQPRGISQRFMSKKNTVIMVIRLLRQARKVWPEACVSIITMLTKHEGKFWDTPLRRSRMAELSYLYNTILSLLAAPASMYPFLSISAQQQAQFVIIRRMHEFEPPLVIDHEGYRAVIRVQLAHKKTFQERDWASLKAKSWPPWKQDKLGLDAEKGLQYGQSRASQAIKNMEEAGYALQEWESAAEILAGWDTDKTPTIQTRASHSRPIMSRGEKVDGDTSRHPQRLLEWTARIQATRTVDEAWAIFLAFKDSTTRDGVSSNSPKVYHAMAEKIHFNSRRYTKQAQPQKAELQLEEITPLPGDGKEVFEPPGPREAIYVRSTAPDIDQFFDMMLKDNVLPSLRGLSSLLFYSKSFKIGIHYLVRSQFPTALLRNLLTGDPTLIASPLGHGRMPNYLFSAFIRHLSRFGHRTHHAWMTQIDIPDTYPAGVIRLRINPLVQACKLMSAYKPYYRPPWNALLQGLARKGVSLATSAPTVNHEIQDILAWKAILRVVDDMRMTGLGLDLSGFRHVCIGYEKAITANAELTHAADLTQLHKILDCDVESLIHDGLAYIKDLFKSIVSGGPLYQVSARLDVGIPEADYLLPRLLETPSPAHIHPFIRILGFREDHGGLVELVEWMAEFAPELQSRAAEVMNGERMMRRCLTAAVVFLEQSWLPPEERIQYGGKCNNDSDEDSGKDASRTAYCESSNHTKNGTLEQRFRRVIAENSDWGGWPSDDEIDVYMGRQSTD